MKVCKIKGCGGSVTARGWCVKHYLRWYKHGDPNFVAAIRDGRTSHSLYSTWRSMLDRCYNPENRQYKDYGGRGITVCKRWRNNFWDFVEDVGPKPEGKIHDRKNNNRGYMPSNCRWVSHSESQFNRRGCGSLEKCPNGHPRNEVNLWVAKDGRRHCRACGREVTRRQREKRRAA